MGAPSDAQPSDRSQLAQTRPHPHPVICGRAGSLVAGVTGSSLPAITRLRAGARRTPTATLPSRRTASPSSRWIKACLLERWHRSSRLSTLVALSRRTGQRSPPPRLQTFASVDYSRSGIVGAPFATSDGTQHRNPRLGSVASGLPNSRSCSPRPPRTAQPPIVRRLKPIHQRHPNAKQRAGEPARLNRSAGAGTRTLD